MPMSGVKYSRPTRKSDPETRHAKKSRKKTGPSVGPKRLKATASGKIAPNRDVVFYFAFISLALSRTFEFGKLVELIFF
jgi:hypothetical protein